MGWTIALILGCGIVGSNIGYTINDIFKGNIFTGMLLGGTVSLLLASIISILTDTN